jgi:hypothetical protein
MCKISTLIFSGLTFSFALSLHAEQQAIPDATIFSGHWEGSRDAGEDTASLSLSLIQNNDKLTGSYCYIARNGRRIDCPDDRALNLQGSVKGSIATVVFDSSFGGKNGKAVLRVNGNKMQWELTLTPQDGEYYTPDKFSLTRKNSAASTQNTAETKNILDDKSVQNNLKVMLGERYDAFINNFEVLGESLEAHDGSIFIEGWMPHLAQVNASALIVEANGNLFAAWVTPESDVIDYQSSYTQQGIPDALLAWSERFAPKHFALRSNVLKSDAYSEQFETEKFNISISVQCGRQPKCNDAVYHGVR